MKMISIKDLRTSPASVWKKLSIEREMIITNNGKPFALLVPISDEMMEDTVSAIRRAKALNAMKKMQEISASLGHNKLSLDEINAAVKDARKVKK